MVKIKTASSAVITKKDWQNAFKNLATKSDLKNFATKDDLKRFATKDDLKNLVTNERLSREIADLVSNFHGEMEFRFDQTDQKIEAVKTDVSQLKTDVTQLKTDVSQLKTDITRLKGRVTVKEDVLEARDEVIKVLRDMQEEKDIHQFSHQRTNEELEEHEERITRLEQLSPAAVGV